MRMFITSAQRPTSLSDYDGGRGGRLPGSWHRQRGQVGDQPLLGRHDRVGGQDEALLGGTLRCPGKGPPKSQRSSSDCKALQPLKQIGSVGAEGERLAELRGPQHFVEEVVRE